jgi:MFS family permease
MPPWLVALAIILVLQTAAAYLTRLIPVVSPAFMAEFGWDQSWIGYLSAANIIGALVILLAAVELLRRIGYVLAFYATLIVGAAALMLFHVPWIGAALIASALTGPSNAAANPAGADVLQRFTPEARRNLVFSIKQAGVPLGGVVAGLTIPPLVEAFGWRSALLIAGAGTIALTLLMLPLRSRIEAPRETRPAGRMRVDFAVPLRSLKSAPGMLRIAGVGIALSVAQSSWFTFAVVYLVIAHGLSLARAGAVFAVMQAFGVAGRIAAGWIADRAGSVATLMSMATLSGSLTIAFALLRPEWPLWSLMLLAALAGATVAGWNGVEIAEVARRSPRHLIGETASGNTILIYLTNMVAPTAFAAFVAATGRFDVAFVVAGLCALMCVPLLWGVDRNPHL